MVAGVLSLLGVGLHVQNLDHLLGVTDGDEVTIPGLDHAVHCVTIAYLHGFQVLEVSIVDLDVASVVSDPELLHLVAVDNGSGSAFVESVG